MGTPDVLLLLRLLLACRRHERGQLPPDHMTADADGEDIIADSFDAVGQLVSVEDVALVPATMAVLMEQAKATKLLAPAWARCSLEACLELASALQLNGMEITEAPKRRRRGLPARGHSAWAQGATIGMGLYPSAVINPPTWSGVCPMSVRCIQVHHRRSVQNVSPPPSFRHCSTTLAPRTAASTSETMAA